jgi:hypothetical protein
MDLGDDDLQLHCIIEGEAETFPVNVPGSVWHNPKFNVGHLKEKIQVRRKDGSLAGVDAHTLVLWKVRAIEESRCLEICLISRPFSPKRGILSVRNRNRLFSDVSLLLGNLGKN